MSMPQEPEQVHMPHDKGYRHLFTSKKVFLQLIRSFIKHGWAEQIDEANLEYINRTFVLQDFKDKEADVVYRAKLKERDVIFYVLMEMQSTVDFMIPQRLLLYMNEIWRTILKNMPQGETERKDFRMPAIVPIVLYNGKAAWTVPLNFKETLNSYDIFGENLVDFRYILIPVQSYSEAELLKLSNLIALIFRLDRVDNLEEILETFVKFISVINKLTTEEFSLFMAWAIQALPGSFPEENKNEIIRVLKEAHPKEVETLISNVERAVKKSLDDAQKEGMEKGIQKVAKQMLAEGYDVDSILRCTGLSKEEIEKLG